MHQFAAFIAFMTALLIANPEIHAIKQSTISTAGIGYLFIPFMVVPGVGMVLVCYYAGAYIIQKIEARKFSILVPLCVIAIILCSFLLHRFYIAPYLVTKHWEAVIAPISKMTHEEIHELIMGYEGQHEAAEQRIYILNAIMQHKGLTAEELDTIARLPEPRLHDKLSSIGNLLGINRKGLSVARLVAKHPNVSVSTLTFLAGANDPYLLGDIASNRKTPVDILQRLYEQSKKIEYGELIHSGLAHNIHTPVSILEEISLSPNEYTASYVAGNASTPVPTLIALYEKSKTMPRGAQTIQWRLAMNENTPMLLLQEMSQSTDSVTQRYATGTLEKIKYKSRQH